MANQEQLEILAQGVDAWNKWRMEHQDISPYFGDVWLRGANLTGAIFYDADFTGADLSGSDLTGADLSDADLRNATLIGATLIGAKLSNARLGGAYINAAELSDTNISNANLVAANLEYTLLRNADLTGVDLSSANLSNTNLRSADLKNAELSFANLSSTNLFNTNFNNARVGWTIFADVDLSVVKNLETIQHTAPSTIGIDTIIRSQGNIPEIFLQRAGVPSSIIKQIPALIGSLKPIDFYSCFISYSSKNDDFARRLHAGLVENGVRCWFAPHDMRTGKVILKGIDEAIRQYDKLLLILSRHSVASNWVEHEVDMALCKEMQNKHQDVLFPIRLDNAILKSPSEWAKNLCHRYVGDFTKWQQQDDYQKAFTRLLSDLKIEAQKMESRDTTT